MTAPPRRPLSDVLVPLAVGAALGRALRAARAMSARRRTVARVTALRDAPALLFEFDEPAEPQPTLVPAPGDGGWTPPSTEPIVDSMPVPLPASPEEEAPADAAVTVPPAPAPDAAPRIVAEAEALLAAPPVVADGPLPAWATALGVFDLETTGVDPATARIVTAHVGLIDETGAVVERKDWIVDPGVPIPAGAAAVHGITDERAQRFGRPPGEVVAEILGAIRSVFARGFPLVVFNAPYDLTLLAAEADRHRLWPLEATSPVVDPLVLDKRIDRYRKGKRTLVAQAEVYGVALTDAHDAGADAIAAGRVAQAMARRHGDVLDRTADALHDAQARWCADQAERFQAYMRESKDPDFTCDPAWPVR